MNIEELRDFCLNLPHTKEDVKWGADLCFTIGEKMYCVTGLESTSFNLSLKVTPEEFDLLITLHDITPAPYLARYKWVAIKGEDTLSLAEWHYYIKQSYELVKSKLPKKRLGTIQ